MTFLVPFDGSPLARAALARARLYAMALEAAPPDLRREALREGPLDVIAVAVVPDSERYAREKGWLGPDEAFSVRGVVEDLHEQVTAVDPGASFQFDRVDAAATAGTISHRLRRRAEAAEVSVVFVGSRNAGRIITPLTSVGGGVAADEDFDVHIVRQPLPPEARERLRSEFFLVD